MNEKKSTRKVEQFQSLSSDVIEILINVIKSWDEQSLP